MARTPLSYYDDPENPNPGDVDDDSWRRTLLDPATGEEPEVEDLGNRNDVAPIPTAPQGQSRPVIEPTPNYDPNALPMAPVANPNADAAAPDISHLNDSTNPDDYLAPEALMSQPEAAPSAESIQERARRAANASPDRAVSSSSESRLVDTKPSWYNDEAPPDEMTWAKILLGLGSSGLMAGLAPDGKSAAAAGLGGLLQTAGAVIDDPNKNYDKRLKAAKVQSDMTEKLNTRNASAANADLARARFGYQLDSDEAKARAQKDFGDPNSAVSKDATDIAIRAGWLTENDRGKWSAQQLKDERARAGSAAQQARGFEHQDAAADTRQQNAIDRMGIADEFKQGQEQRKEGYTIEGEERKRVAEVDSAQIPGWKMRGDRPPSDTDVARARELTTASDNGEYASQKLMELQKKLSAGRLTGRLYQYFADDPEGQQALADARVYQKMLMDSQRAMSNLGVLQQFEKEMVEATNPEAGSLDEFFIGPFNYSAYSRILPEVAERQMKRYKYDRDNGENPVSAPAPVQRKKLIPEINRAAPVMGAATTEAIDTAKQVGSNAIDTAKQVGGAAADIAKPAVDAVKEFIITLPSGKEIVRKMTDAAAAEAGKTNQVRPR